jgi:protein-S-isoprenylcysteine O-methyltransferase Ste14
MEFAPLDITILLICIIAIVVPVGAILRPLLGPPDPRAIHRRREHGLNENHVMLVLIVAIVAFLGVVSWLHPDISIPRLAGQRVIRLLLALVTAVLWLAFLGGWRYQLVEKLKTNPIALAITSAGFFVMVGLAMSGL